MSAEEKMSRREAIARIGKVAAGAVIGGALPVAARKVDACVDRVSVKFDDEDMHAYVAGAALGAGLSWVAINSAPTATGRAPEGAQAQPVQETEAERDLGL